MANTCRWDSLSARFHVHVLKPYWVCAPPRNDINFAWICLETWFVCKFVGSRGAICFILGIFYQYLFIDVLFIRFWLVFRFILFTYFVILLSVRSSLYATWMKINEPNLRKWQKTLFWARFLHIWSKFGLFFFFQKSGFVSTRYYKQLS